MSKKYQNFVVYFIGRRVTEVTLRASSQQDAFKVARKLFPKKRILHIVPSSMAVSSPGGSESGQVQNSSTTRERTESKPRSNGVQRKNRRSYKERVGKQTNRRRSRVPRRHG